MGFTAENPSHFSYTEFRAKTIQCDLKACHRCKKPFGPDETSIKIQKISRGRKRNADGSKRFLLNEDVYAIVSAYHEKCIPPTLRKKLGRPGPGLLNSLPSKEQASCGPGTLSYAD